MEPPPGGLDEVFFVPFWCSRSWPAAWTEQGHLRADPRPGRRFPLGLLEACFLPESESLVNDHEFGDETFPVSAEPLNWVYIIIYNIIIIYIINQSQTQVPRAINTKSAKYLQTHLQRIWWQRRMRKERFKHSAKGSKTTKLTVANASQHRLVEWSKSFCLSCWISVGQTLVYVWFKCLALARPLCQNSTSMLNLRLWSILGAPGCSC